MALPLSIVPNIPAAVVASYERSGVSSLFPWQLHCLLNTSVLSGRNLIYNAPTSGGKTLVSELLIISRFQQSHKKTVFILPYISIVSEKARCFDRVMKPAGMRVRAFCGNQGDGDLNRTDVALCTIEKANRILTKAVDERKIGEIGLVVVDEIHMAADSSRGALLECLLTKVLYAQGVQVVGMSATLPNIEEVAEWLQAEAFRSEFRPVPLQQFAVVSNRIYTSRWEQCRVLPAHQSLSTLSSEVQSCIIFCPTRAMCEKKAKELLRNRGESGESQVVAQKVKECGGDLTLVECVGKGVAYHHSGLTNEEKEVVESAFCAGTIRVITATSTLAAGVNLPAQRVIITSPRIGNAPLPVSQYLQMCGRAGRTGCDTSGDSYLFCDSKEAADAYMNSKLPPVKSALDAHGLKRLILDVISTEMCHTFSDILHCVGLTLYARNHSESITAEATAAVTYLIDNKMLEESEGLLRPTLLGRAVLSSSLAPEEGLVVFMELERAEEKLCLLSDLHVIYLSAPILSNLRPNWRLMLPIVVKSKESPHFLSIAESLGISEDFICRSELYPPAALSTQQLVSVRYDSRDTDDYQLIVHTRFYSALVLMSLNSGGEDTAQRFGIDRGSLQAFIHQSSTYLSLLAVFVGRLNWWLFESLFVALRERAAYIDQSDIQPLLSVPGIDVEKARILVAAGLHTIGRIARAPISYLSKLFEKYCLPDSASLAIAISNSARKRFAAVFLTNKRKKTVRY